MNGRNLLNVIDYVRKVIVRNTFGEETFQFSRRFRIHMGGESLKTKEFDIRSMNFSEILSFYAF